MQGSLSKEEYAQDEAGDLAESLHDVADAEQKVREPSGARAGRVDSPSSIGDDARHGTVTMSSAPRLDTLLPVIERTRKLLGSELGGPEDELKGVAAESEEQDGGDPDPEVLEGHANRGPTTTSPIPITSVDNSRREQPFMRTQHTPTWEVIKEAPSSPEESINGAQALGSSLEHQKDLSKSRGSMPSSHPAPLNQHTPPVTHSTADIALQQPSNGYTQAIETIPTSRSTRKNGKRSSNEDSTLPPESHFQASTHTRAPNNRFSVPAVSAETNVGGQNSSNEQASLFPGQAPNQTTTSPVYQSQDTIQSVPRPYHSYDGSKQPPAPAEEQRHDAKKMGIDIDTKPVPEASGFWRHSKPASFTNSLFMVAMLAERQR
ncbi:hypothetical protein FRB98_005186 [Tulasnella sp. 332]|nr:hypothetical protein FRB98_005186 [Tulasnella sp. 332]